MADEQIYFEGMDAMFFEEKAQKLSGVARLLDYLFPSNYNQLISEVRLLKQQNKPKEALHFFRKALLPIANEIAIFFPGIGVAYYSIDVDSIVAYAPETDFKDKIGITVPPNHIGRIAMSNKKEIIGIGKMIRGDIIACVQPLIRNEIVIGFVGATESIEDICNKLIGRKNKYTFCRIDCPNEIVDRIEDAITSASKDKVGIVAKTQDTLDEKVIIKNKEMILIYDQLEKAASTDASVFLQGQSGTGKEIMAKYIHNSSNRKTNIFLPINCGAMPENLLESELFGYDAGAFTGASKTKPGKIELANNGTLFLDELEAMPYNSQCKLLRFLEDRTIEHLGSVKKINVNVRIISATNASLPDLIKKGRFREDLYYRLVVIPINIPALRERLDEVLPLAEYYLDYFSKLYSIKPVTLSKEAKEALLDYDYPGNVRELKNIMERVAVLRTGGEVTANILNEQFLCAEGKCSQNANNLFDAKAELELKMIKDVLLSVDGNRTKASQHLGISRRWLQKKIKQYQIM